MRVEGQVVGGISMKTLYILLAAALVLAWFPAHVRAHEVPNIRHTHAFEQTGYGTYRQGHSVNGPLGSIIIWSPRPYTGYQAGSSVKFARPVPMTKAPGSPVVTTRSKDDPAKEYGKR